MEETPVLRSNQCAVQLVAGPDGKPDEAVLVMGNVTPPLLSGSPEEYGAMLSLTGALTVKTLGRYSMSRGRLGELIQYLTAQADAWDRQS